MKRWVVIVVVLLLLVVSCQRRPVRPNPWGASTTAADSASAPLLDDIIVHGELIMVTLSGPETYYEYHGRGLGLHYLLCEKFCKDIGVALRVDVCKDTADLLRRVATGAADLVALPLTASYEGLASCGGAADGWHWLVNAANTPLAAALDGWLTAARVAQTAQEEDYYLSPQSITRTVYAPVQDKAKGIISPYDHLFRRYCRVARCDWRLLAAQCYQESTFDPRAHSWAGACGLMQIMPATADHLQLPRTEIYNPEKNVAAAAKYLAELAALFSDIPNATERMKFVLASYNGGHHHIRDAMALADKYGANARRWSDVRPYVLCLSKAAYYNDPVVKYGYMRGSETAAYVDKILDRWDYYRGVRSTLARDASPSGAAPAGDAAPRRAAKRKAKYTL